jgi:two-component system, NtrC family, nitrogen regulation sensor histidine kinase GlnL
MSGQEVPGNAGLDLLATAVVVLDAALVIRQVNAATESLLGTSRRALIGTGFMSLFSDAGELDGQIRSALSTQRGFWNQSVRLARPDGESLWVNCLATPVEQSEAGLVLELREIEQQLRVEREAQLLVQSRANRELIRNLAHEIKNPLGGLRGSAQLLEAELDRPELREYTQVIIQEADRLQRLLERLLTPHRPPRIEGVNIHEVCERVRSLILAEFPQGIALRRDYDTSLPELAGDREQLIQVVLNITRNAAQVLLSPAGREWLSSQGQSGVIELRTRVAYAVTIARERYRLALDLQVIDNGPGVPPAIIDRIFYPLVSGRDGGTGLGLTLAQTYVQHHRGVVECNSQPGRTVFRVLLPIGGSPGPGIDAAAL